MSATIRIDIDEHAMDTLDRQLARVEVMDRDRVLNKIIRAAANVPARRLRQILPKPGYPGDKPGLTPLRKTVKVKVKKYNKVTVAIMGYDYNGGQHGHLVEEGHVKVVWGNKTGGRVEGKHYLQKSVEDTREATSREVESASAKFIAKELS